MKTRARKIRVAQISNIRGTNGTGRQRARLRVPRNTRIRVRRS